ncbi:hypothetical protein MGAD_09110 [Mycolicibacterium gadium]|uniref:Uncharacterized protein n=1 Tax=Mycolicibacterium gadium TaxID=1794 RepID=A0A7I7WG17_MYCGU|nr:hypothetical protein MGAD_09110 [Mycolicibacterium gadium]
MRIIGRTCPDSELAATTMRPKVAPFKEQFDSAAESRRLRTLLPPGAESNLRSDHSLDLNHG